MKKVLSVLLLVFVFTSSAQKYDYGILHASEPFRKITWSNGQKTDKILKEILPSLILSIPFRKSMKWSDGDITFVRPLRWILATLGGKTISFNLEN